MDEIQVENKKKLIIIIACILAVLVVAVTFVSLLTTAESRIVGIWEREPMYLEYYGCPAIMTTKFMDDGTYVSVLTVATTGTHLNTSAGVWTRQGFKVRAKEIGSDSTTVYTFNPITGTIKNGDNKYTKIG